MHLQGIFCPVTTPFVNERASGEKLGLNLKQFQTTGLSGYVLFGSTGEAPYITVQERVKLIKSARRAIPSDGPKLIVGTGFETTSETVDFTKEAAAQGANFALVLTPHYYKKQMTDAILIRHFTTVADESPIPVILYNVPPFTGVDMSVQAVLELAKHPNIIGIKDSTADISKLISLIHATSGKLSVLVGNAFFYLSGLLAGGQGAVLAVANILPKDCVQILRSHEQRDYKAAIGATNRIAAAVTTIITPYGIPAIKAALDMLGFYGGPPRKPFLPVATEARDIIRKVLVKMELL